MQNAAVENPKIASMVEQCKQNPNEETQARLSQLAASYYLEQKSRGNEPLDPVARFHLKNGAILDRINPSADPSEKGLQQSFGLMVNYVYDLTKVEENHEAYMKNHKIVCSSQVKKLLQG